MTSMFLVVTGCFMLSSATTSCHLPLPPSRHRLGKGTLSNCESPLHCLSCGRNINYFRPVLTNLSSRSTRHQTRGRICFLVEASFNIKFQVGALSVLRRLALGITNDSASVSL
ncbi:hypothetical protein V8E55_006010 [Tylopilus felleus]